MASLRGRRSPEVLAVSAGRSPSVAAPRAVEAYAATTVTCLVTGAPVVPAAWRLARVGHTSRCRPKTCALLRLLFHPSRASQSASAKNPTAVSREQRSRSSVRISGLTFIDLKARAAWRRCR